MHLRSAIPIIVSIVWITSVHAETYSNDASGRYSAITYPNGQVFYYRYDRSGNLLEVDTEVVQPVLTTARTEDFYLEVKAKEKGETTAAPLLVAEKNKETEASNHTVWGNSPQYAKETGLWAKATPEETAAGEIVWRVEVTKKDRIPSASPYPVVSTRRGDQNGLKPPGSDLRDSRLQERPGQQSPKILNL